MFCREIGAKAGGPEPLFRETYGKIPNFCDIFLRTPTTRENHGPAFFAKISSFAAIRAGNQA
jgi:hypothetical protein